MPDPSIANRELGCASSSQYKDDIEEDGEIHNVAELDKVYTNLMTKKENV